MSYKALYRRWRPKVFEDVIGQEQVITILKNQINSSNIAHAYLFTGTRGTGKTSTAKIFARVVNCLNPKDANPCNSCEVCEGILTENIMDVIEIDAASNNGVDNVREIRENVKYPPSKGKYKIYIIDEVHMLSTGAFNALLKTLEEPPSYVIFILATTEPHKIPATILSRCQRFDFKPVKIRDIMGHLSFICDEIGVTWDEEALRLIAINSEGALRDALSILERCISFSEDTLTYENVVSILGMVNYEFIFNLVDKVAEKDTSNVLTLINEMVMEGKEVGQLMKDLISHFRNLLLVKMNVEIDEILSLSEERQKRLQEQGRLFTINQITSFIYSLSDIEGKLKYSAQPRTLIEIAVIGLCNKELDDSLDGIIERVKQLEKNIVSGEITVNRSNVNISPSVPNKASISSSYSQKNKYDEKKSMDEEESKEENMIREEGIIDNNSLLDFGAIQSNWQNILEELRKEKKAQIQALLMEGSLVKVDKDTLLISFKDGFGFHREALNKEKTKEYISGIIKRLTGQSIRLSFVMEDQLITEIEPKEEKDPLEMLKEALPKEIHEILEIVDE